MRAGRHAVVAAPGDRMCGRLCAPHRRGGLGVVVGGGAYGGAHRHEGLVHLGVRRAPRLVRLEMRGGCGAGPRLVQPRHPPAQVDDDLGELRLDRRQGGHDLRGELEVDGVGEAHESRLCQERQRRRGAGVALSRRRSGTSRASPRGRSATTPRRRTPAATRSTPPRTLSPRRRASRPATVDLTGRAGSGVGQRGRGAAHLRHGGVELGGRELDRHDPNAAQWQAPRSERAAKSNLWITRTAISCARSG